MTDEKTYNTSTLAQLRSWYAAHPPGMSAGGADSLGAPALAAYQQKARRRLRLLLGLDKLEATSCPPEAEVLERISAERYRGEKLLVKVQADMYVPAWVLVPRTAPPHPAIMCFHGHGLSKEVTIGRPRTEQEKEKITIHRGDYGRGFAEAGFAVFCPDARGFGERDGAAGCAHLGLNAQMAGLTLGGLRMWDHLRCLEYLLARPDIDRRRVGAAGLSMGCEHSLYLAALDERVSLAILSCCLRDWRDEVHDQSHCPCSYLPGLFEHFDWSDIACLISPRPVLVQQGVHDYVPMKFVESALEKIRRVYRSVNAEDKVGTDFFNGKHEFNLAGALHWLDQRR